MATPIDAIPPVGTTSSLNGAYLDAYVQFEDINNLLETDTSVTTTAATDDSAVLNDAYSVNLSPQAISILSSLNLLGNLNNATDSVNAFFGTTGVSSGAGVTVDLTLTATQQQQVDAILTTFANVPLTPTVLNQIEGILIGSGLTSDQLLLQNIINNPGQTQWLQNLLNLLQNPVTTSTAIVSNPTLSLYMVIEELIGEMEMSQNAITVTTSEKKVEPV